jgi:hypothetical protein
MSWQGGQLIGTSPSCFPVAIPIPIQLREFECPHLAKPYRVTDLIFEAAEAITHASENIRRIKASLAKLAATTEGLKARPMNESKAVLAGGPPSEPVIPSDVIDEWLFEPLTRVRAGGTIGFSEPAKTNRRAHNQQQRCIGVSPKPGSQT